jgi:hypothetical protein
MFAQILFILEILSFAGEWIELELIHVKQNRPHGERWEYDGSTWFANVKRMQ